MKKLLLIMALLFGFSGLCLLQGEVSSKDLVELDGAWFLDEEPNLFLIVSHIDQLITVTYYHKFSDNFFKVTSSKGQIVKKDNYSLFFDTGDRLPYSLSFQYYQGNNVAFNLLEVIYHNLRFAKLNSPLYLRMVHFVDEATKAGLVNKMPTNTIPAFNWRTGFINDGEVRLRDAPNLQSKQVALLDKKTVIEILDQTKDKTTVGGITASWYKVKLLDNTTGWVFGQFVTEAYDWPGKPSK